MTLRAKRTSIILALLTTFTLLAAAQTGPVRVALESAKKKELVDGDLNAAIQQYKAVVSKYPRERAVVADALIHMAECYQKLGDAESRKIYEHVLRDYADQKDAASIARARLGRTATSDRAAAMLSRQVWTLPAPVVLYGRVSHDGRYLPYSDWSRKGDLFLHDLVSGSNREIVNKRSSGFEFAEFGGAFSPDNTQLAFGWFNNNYYEVRVAGLSDGSASRVLFSNPEVPVVSPEDWSPDGKWLAVQLQRKDKTAQIGLVAVQDGTLRPLKSVDWRGSTKLFFSPDGKYLAYDLPATLNSDRRDVFVLAVDGSREIPAVEHPSDDVVMGWSPDGRYLLFTSNRTGSPGLWALAFVDGKPLGTPLQIKADVSGTSMSLTKNGTLLTLTHHSNFTGVSRSDIQVAQFDFDKGQFLPTPRSAVQAFTGANNFPAWSVDGRYLAFLSTRSVEKGNRVIVIQSQETGELRELRPGLNIYSGGPGPRWSPDGLSLAIQGTDPKGRQGIFRIDTTTGEASPIALGTRMPAGGGESLSGPLWAPDGRKIYYSRLSSGGQWTAIVENDLASGNEKEITRRSGRFPMLDLSPDGKYFAAPDGDWFAGAPVEPGRNRNWSILLIPVNGAEPRELMRGESHGAGVLMWAPDNRSVFIYSTKDKATRQLEVWRIALDGTERRKLAVDVSFIGPLGNSDQQLHPHPDGKRVAFAAAEPAKPAEVWALENFLPKSNVGK